MTEVERRKLRMEPGPYWGHLFSRHKLRGDWITWSFGRCWWLRIGRVILRAEYIRPNANESNKGENA